jgi:glycosyltransferase involved in cell wall biosynthesis
MKRYANRFFLLLSASPPILYVKDWLLLWKMTSFHLLLQLLRGRRVYLLVSPSWSRESSPWQDARLIGDYRKRYGDWQFIYLANTARELEIFQENGIRAIFCNQNAFLDPAVFFPFPNSKRRFRAIYDAAFIPYKRHYLASKVSGLAVTAYVKKDTCSQDIRSVKESLPHAVWLKDGSVTGNIWLSDHEINVFLNEAQVGLCLSAVEGAMWASAQYLLAGLPVVSTHCRGGREIFFDTDFVRYVADDPDDVAKAVNEFCAAPPDPLQIRHRTLARFAEHRSRLVDLVNSIYNDEGRTTKWADEWPSHLPNKLHGGNFPIANYFAALTGKKGAFPWLDSMAQRNSRRDEGSADVLD